uniref:ligand of Numb protein X 2-like isoform X2 n=1 Tax=Myxine glutinosa TaxID=7769 RepID=UPI00358F8864
MDVAHQSKPPEVIQCMEEMANRDGEEVEEVEEAEEAEEAEEEEEEEEDEADIGRSSVTVAENIPLEMENTDQEAVQRPWEANGFCMTCGQCHPDNTVHNYTYQLEVDEELTCRICLDPLLSPLDTPCGHTYCSSCLESFLRPKKKALPSNDSQNGFVTFPERYGGGRRSGGRRRASGYLQNATEEAALENDPDHSVAEEEENEESSRGCCPLDRLPLKLSDCSSSSFLVRRLLDKLLVACPICCQEIQRAELEGHISHRCPGMAVYREEEEKRRRAAVVAAAAATAAATCPGIPLLMGGLSAAEAIALWSDEPGLVNPGFQLSEEEEDGDELIGVSQARIQENQRSTSLWGSSISHSSADFTLEIREGVPTIIELKRSEVFHKLGISIVGGNETPLESIIIQEIFDEGLVARNGGLLPGDRILQLNGSDLRCCSHNEAIAILNTPASLLRMAVLRDCHRPSIPRSVSCPGRAQCPQPPQLCMAERRATETLSVVLCKEWPGEALGLRLGDCPGRPGVKVQHVVVGGLAARQGGLRAGDRVLAINGHDLRHASTEQAVSLIQAFQGPVHFVVLRRVLLGVPDILWEVGPVPSSAPDAQPPTMGPVWFEKKVQVQKLARESLGITVSGGLGCLGGDLPIYTASVDPKGCLGRFQLVKPGDVLLGANNVELTRMAHGEAVSILKGSAAATTVELRILECDMQALPLSRKERSVRDKQQVDRENANERRATTEVELAVEAETLNINKDGGEGGGDVNNIDDDDDCSPTWIMWLKLPSFLQCPKDVPLWRSSCGSLGFSIVGGFEENRGPQPFFVKHIVPGTPAFGSVLRCGDQITAVNGHSTSGMSHQALVQMLKEIAGRVNLKVISWPGSLL